MVLTPPLQISESRKHWIEAQNYPFGYCAERKAYLTLQAYKESVLGWGPVLCVNPPQIPIALYQDNKKR